MKNIIAEIKNILKEINSRLVHSEEQNRHLGERIVETFPSEQQNVKNNFKKRG